MTHPAPGYRPPRVATLLSRALRLRCPRCGGRGILRGWMRMRHECPVCGLVLERGEHGDYWLGAYMFNLVAAELVTVIAVVVWMVVVWPDVPWTAVQWVGVALAAVTPFLFFPFSRTLWLAWDLAFRPAEPGDNVGRPEAGPR